jgi:hypothetical protein
MVFGGAALTITMGHIDDWIARNNVLSTTPSRNAGRDRREE